MSRFRSLPRSFYEPTADVVAAGLLGHWLIRNSPRGQCGGVIVETEAYLTGDAACHAFKGKTKRTRVMWGEPGHGYVYFIYGNHWCFNAVCRPEGIAEAILIRAVEPIFGIEQMLKRRPVKNEHQLTNGPGKLCEAMDIDGGFNGVDLCDVESPLFIAKNKSRNSLVEQSGPIVTTTRIGIIPAADLPLRYYLAGSRFISRLAAAKPK
jgi:DNA-3-methyladenine glycosylase